ncbi:MULTISPECIES: SDR family oxidoreductase [Gammaproteobacteria]|uniref:SDR family oxidoreductase n=7 Tax=Gammaproteobacteria TaxID=1236 RepID=A0ABD7S443_XANVA|nr:MULTISPECIES: SDR family oxidoreductase [Gammaproteobacteria]ASW45316.1 NAD(P)-dependent oxidoreductase [Xanthomonas hortorum]ATS51814.1 SDR family oxidoreductase [Xanthomonas citri pv. phaseoli var. fuscans]ATS80325.1 SDR family oxidoreductase [Xanthomonas citri pv. phaseoli var. fuscans]AZR22952.1 SDR family oxidoreductase [Xanthomonas vasicola]KGR45164.1 sugar dehydrogenase [Xanthomonas vasicola]
MAELAVVTGGSRGIGAAIALKLGGLGYHVVLTYTRDATAAERVIQTIVAAGGKAQAMQLDIACEQQVLTLFNMLDQQGEQLTLLVNNAGITEGFCRLEALTFEQLQRVFQVNVFGAFLCAREAVRRMGYSRGGHGGSIINVSSRAAQLGGGGEWIHYAATKGAIDSLTHGLAKEVAGDGIRVNAVAPGLIETDLHAAAGKPDRAATLATAVPMERAGQPEEVADCVAWLASSAATYVTGAIVPVAGGR